MNNKWAKTVSLFLLIAAFLGMFVFTVFLPRTMESDYSTLKTWPEFSVEALFSGEYFEGIVAYFTDTVPGRDRFIDYNAKIKNLYGLTEDEEVVDRGPDSSESGDSDDEDDFIDQPDWQPEVSTDNNNVSSDTSADVSSDASTPEGDEIKDPDEPMEEELSNSILIIGTRAMEIFGGNLNNGKVFAETLNEFAENINQNINVYSMVIPKASAFYIHQSEKYAKYAPRNKENIDNINQNLSDRVIPIDAYGILEQHANEEIYFRTDHHWTGLGAYYAAKVFADKAGVNFTDLSRYTENRRAGYVGTLYKYSDYNPKLLNNPEDLVTYVPPSEYIATFYDHSFQNPREHSIFWDIAEEKRSSWYSTFLRGDSYSVKIQSKTCSNGRTLLIVKDSYGNALAPYFIDSFETVYIVDARFFEKGLYTFINEQGITDVLFAECTFSSCGAGYINKIKGLMH